MICIQQYLLSVKPYLLPAATMLMRSSGAGEGELIMSRAAPSPSQYLEQWQTV